MTMHIVFLKDYDGYKEGQSCFVERALARRFCENDVAITQKEHLRQLHDIEQAEKKAKEKAKKVIKRKKTIKK